MALTREQILAANDLPTETFPVPEWGGDVNLKLLDGLQREELEKEFKGGSPEGWRALVLSYAVVDDNGARMFSREDAKELMHKSGAVLDRLVDHVIEKNGINEKAKEAAAKN